MVRWSFLGLAAAGTAWPAASAQAAGTTLVTGRIVGRDAGEEKVPVAILVRGADGDRRDLLVSQSGSFSLIGLRAQTYTFQAERPERGSSGALSTALSLPVTLYIYEGARYNIDFPYPKNGRPSTPHAEEQQASDVHVIR